MVFEVSSAAQALRYVTESKNMLWCPVNEDAVKTAEQARRAAATPTDAEAGAQAPRMQSRQHGACSCSNTLRMRNTR